MIQFSSLWYFWSFGFWHSFSKWIIQRNSPRKVPPRKKFHSHRNNFYFIKKFIFRYCTFQVLRLFGHFWAKVFPSELFFFVKFSLPLIHSRQTARCRVRNWNNYTEDCCLKKSYFFLEGQSIVTNDFSTFMTP